MFGWLNSNRKYRVVSVKSNGGKFSVEYGVISLRPESRVGGYGMPFAKLLKALRDYSQSYPVN